MGSHPADGNDATPSGLIEGKAALTKTVDPILERLATLHPKTIDLSLDRIERLLAALGHPEASLPPVVHVAGTNGKGSVVAFLRAILEAAGARVHTYTSPHLVRFNERIALAGRPISEADLIRLLERCEKANGGQPITFFEITTAAAFLAFAEARPKGDVLLLETGLGGRLDATNVVAQPLLSILTPIAIDHTQFLGTSLAEIAAEKAAILKPGVPAIVGPQPAAAATVIAAAATAKRAPLFRAGREWSIAADGKGMRYREGEVELALPMPGLAGAHQVANAGIALVAVRRLEGFAVSDAVLAQGLAGVEWPGRLQRLRQGPLLSLLPPGAELWLDGGHNSAAAAALGTWALAEGRPLGLVFGMLNTKDPVAFLRLLAPHVAALGAVPIPESEAHLSPEALVAAAREAGIADAFAAADPAAAVRRLVRQGGPAPRLLVTGSLYLVGAVLKAAETQPREAVLDA
ncbi:MAG: bifunctional folylpolyglutamate synthase/dihydrofolate synthase [Alphaproteobacteria bacterium]|nr:bifunctional folylpolyglutamate synthase/dihydrofolate synthase [Alphaproteobacteria bacterium]